MKSRRFVLFRRSLPLAASIAVLLRTAGPAPATTLYWDGSDAGATANAQGGAGTWNTLVGNANWDTLAFGGLDSIWTNGGHTAVFGGTSGTVTLGEAITVGGLTFNTTAYTIAAGTSGLSFSAGNNEVKIITNGATSAATVTGAVGGAGANLSLSTIPGASSTLTFSGASSGGWTGSTTINSGLTLTSTSASGLNKVLSATSGITLNGGTIGFVRATNGNIDAINDGAEIIVNGGGTFTTSSNDAGGASANETIGRITVNSGQFNLAWTNAGSSGTTLTVGPSGTGLTRGGGNAAVTFSISNTLAKTFLAGQATTAANEIIGPWATFGTATGTQTDYATYNISGGIANTNGIQGAGIAASAASGWSTTWAATSNYTLTNGSGTAANGKLANPVKVNTVRNTTTASAITSVTFAGAASTDFITITGSAYADGDVVTIGGTTAPGGLTNAVPYYVVGAGANGSGTFQLSATPGGAPIELTSAGTSANVTGGITLPAGSQLGTYGILNGSAASLGIGGSGGTITLPEATSGNLYITAGNAQIQIDAPIVDNGVGNQLTLVKSGNAALTLRAANTYTGGTVINAGTLTIGAASAWVAGQNLTFAGSGTLTASVGAITGGTLTVNQGAVATLTGTSGTTYTSTTGAGTINYGGGSSATLNLGDASMFTGNLQAATGIGGTNPYPNIQFSKLADAPGSFMAFGGGSTDSNQRALFTLGGNVAPLTLNQRQVAILPRYNSNNNSRTLILQNNNAGAANTWVINTDLLNSADRAGQGLVLDGTNLGNNAFAGVIGNSTINGAALNVYKSGTGRWILSGANTFTGRVLANNGTLSVGTFNEPGVAGPLGMGNAIQLGGNESFAGATGVFLGGNNSGTLEYTGGAVISTRTFFIGDTIAANTGGGAVANHGTGAMVFSAATFNSAQTGVTGTRVLTLGGTNTGNNEVQGTIQDNVATTGKVSLAKTGIGTWILSGANALTGTSSISGGGTLVLNYGGGNDNAKLASGALTLDGGTIILRGGSHSEVVASTTIAANNTGTFINREAGSSAVLNLNAISRTANHSVVALSEPGIATTDALNDASGILGGHITVGSDWAINSTGSADGPITAYTGYNTNFSAAAGTNSAIDFTNYKLDGAGGLTTSVWINTLRLANTADDQTLDLTSFGLNLGNITSTTGGGIGGVLYAGGANGNYTITGTTGRLGSYNGNGQGLLINVHSGKLNLDALLQNGSSAVAKTGLGTLVISRDNSASFAGGALRIYQGVVRLTNGNAAGTVAGGITVQNGATLELANDISVGAEALTITGKGVSNGGALRNSGGANTYGGAITIGSGGASIHADAGSTLMLTGGIVTGVGNHVTFGGAGDTTVSTAAITGAGGVIKEGLGTLLLNGVHAYTGGTTVNAGTLLVSGSISGSTTTVNGGTFGGAGGFTGAVLVNGGGTLAPGSSIGTLSTGDVTFSSGGTFALEINSTGLTTDLLASSGTVRLNLATLSPMDLDPTAIFTGTFTFVTAGSVIGEFAGLSQGSSLFVSGNEYNINYTSDSVQLIAVPEPSSLTVLVGGLGLLAGVRRFRVRR